MFSSQVKQSRPHARRGAAGSSTIEAWLLPTVSCSWVQAPVGEVHTGTHLSRLQCRDGNVGGERVWGGRCLVHSGVVRDAISKIAR